jgi:hypothetical protein
MKIPSNLATNISKLLRKGLIEPINSLGEEQFQITGSGWKVIEYLLSSADKSKEPKVSAATIKMKRISEITDASEKDYLEEAMKCLEVGAQRGAIIMSWIASMSHIAGIVDKIGFGPFEKAYRARFPDSRTRKATRKEDLEYYHENDIIQICEDLGIFDRSEKRTLMEDCLGLRNRCAHPGNFSPGPEKVNAYLEDIFSIVFPK